MTISISCEARRNQTSILSRAEKITFLPKPDGHTYGGTDISIYRVASLLKIILFRLDCMQDGKEERRNKIKNRYVRKWFRSRQLELCCQEKGTSAKPYFYLEFKILDYLVFCSWSTNNPPPFFLILVPVGGSNPGGR